MAGMGRGVIRDLTGQPFGRLRVQGRTKKTKWGNVVWRCLCDPELGGCGSTAEVTGRALRSGDTPSCGCLTLELTKPLWDGVCKACGAAFRGTARQKFCSPDCRPSNNRWKRRRPKPAAGDPVPDPPAGPGRSGTGSLP